MAAGRQSAVSIKKVTLVGGLSTAAPRRQDGDATTSL